MVAEEGDRLVVVDGMGVTLRKRKDDASLPEFLAWPVANRDDWERLKAERFQVRIQERLPANWTAPGTAIPGARLSRSPSPAATAAFSARCAP